MRVPTLLHHDLDQHILILSDLGLLPNLSECFSNLHSISLSKSTNESAENRLAPRTASISPALGLSIGQKVGSFFARLHQPQNAGMIKAPPYEDVDFLRHDAMSQLVLEEAIKPVEGQLGQFPHLASQAEISAVYQRVEENFTRKTEDDETVITLGDCWTGALLVGPDDLPAAPQVGIIDWEFSSIGRGLNGDIAQLLAHLHLFDIAAVWQEDTDSRMAVSAIIKGLIEEYRHRSQVLGAPWLPRAVLSVPEPNSPSVKVMRSAFLAHGAEMVNNAFWKDWACTNIRCCGTGSSEKRRCKLVQTMVEKGWWYLQHARENGESFVNKQNWAAVHQDTMIFPIFYGQ